jgi:hypothetical protein
MNAEQYLTACGWQRVPGSTGWEHPDEPGRALDTASALIEQGNKRRPARSWSSVVPYGARPDPTQWERDHG